jgi:hypothetical protein
MGKIFLANFMYRDGETKELENISKSIRANSKTAAIKKAKEAYPAWRYLSIKQL